MRINASGYESLNLIQIIAYHYLSVFLFVDKTSNP